MTRVNFVLCLHNHQPVDNFDSVFARATEDSYLPFLERIERRPGLKFAAHYSGPLLEWLQKNRVDLFLRLRRLADAGRLELVGGGFFEPVMTMLPDRDLKGQVQMMSEFLARHFGAEPAGAWLPERVWEQSLVPALVGAGVRYTILDDFHFKAAGVAPSDLGGWFITEDRGSLLRVFPIHEELRYAIPYKDPQATIDYLLRFADDTGTRTVVYADDGEKFGLWPNTKKHVYEDGWLERFLDALERNADRVRTVTFKEALELGPPAGRVYLPSTSYREMGEWSLPAPAQAQYEGLLEDLRKQGRLEELKHFLPGGTWRGFKTKYPEANLMYGRMLSVSAKVAEADAPVRKKAEEELYRGQCNCGYWHGVFGGLYLPHLRGSVYRHLIAAENAVELGPKRKAGAGYKLLDLDLDGLEDVRLHNDRLNLFVLPPHGGQVVEIDVRDAGVNLGASFARRREHYHSKLRQAGASSGEAKSIHDQVLSKVSHPEEHLYYDAHPRGSLVDHFYDPAATHDDVARGLKDQGDFAAGRYAHTVEKRGGRIALVLSRRGTAAGVPVSLVKEVSIGAEGGEYQAKYTITAERDLETVFGVEFNLALLSPDAPAAEFLGPDGKAVGSLSQRLAIAGDRLGWHETWYGLHGEFGVSAPTVFWTYPVQTVSLSEEGFELTYQGTAVLPHWKLKLAAGKPWTVVLRQKAERRP